MAKTTILHEYERWLAGRVARGEIAESTFDTYLNDASRVLETLLTSLPANVIEGYLKSAGYKGYYGHIVETLRLMARPPRHTAFRQPQEGQQKLPGIEV